MTTFEDKLFALIHGLPVADEPEGTLSLDRVNQA